MLLPLTPSFVLTCHGLHISMGTAANTFMEDRREGKKGVEGSAGRLKPLYEMIALEQQQTVKEGD